MTSHYITHVSKFLIGNEQSSCPKIKYLALVDRSASMRDCYSSIVSSLSTMYSNLVNNNPKAFYLGSILFDKYIEFAQTIDDLSCSMVGGTTDIIGALKYIGEFLEKEFLSNDDLENTTYNILLVSDGGDNCNSDFTNQYSAMGRQVSKWLSEFKTTS